MSIGAAYYEDLGGLPLFLLMGSAADVAKLGSSAEERLPALVVIGMAELLHITRLR